MAAVEIGENNCPLQMSWLTALELPECLRRAHFRQPMRQATRAQDRSSTHGPDFLVSDRSRCIPIASPVVAHSDRFILRSNAE
jgi:hypothetical protein